MIRLALVYFPSERKSYVVPVHDIIDLPAPKSVNDFDRRKLHKVRWTVVTEDGEKTESPFDGKIQLLASK